MGPQGPIGPSNLLIGGGTNLTNLATGAVRYVPMFDASRSATEADVQTILPIAGTLTKFRVHLNGTPGAAASTKAYTFVVRVTGADSTVTCQVLETATTCSDTTHSTMFAAGDLISIRVTPSGTALAALAMTWTAILTP